MKSPLYPPALVAAIALLCLCIPFRTAAAQALSASSSPSPAPVVPTKAQTPATSSNGVTIPGPLRSFLRMAGISQEAAPEDVLPLLARNVYDLRLSATQAN